MLSPARSLNVTVPGYSVVVEGPAPVERPRPVTANATAMSAAFFDMFSLLHSMAWGVAYLAFGCPTGALVDEALQRFDSQLERQGVLSFVDRARVWAAWQLQQRARLHVLLGGQIVSYRQPAGHRR